MPRRFSIYIPLKRFKYHTDEFEIYPDVILKRMTSHSQVKKCKRMVSKDEWEDATRTPFWVNFTWSEDCQFSTSETMNLVLLSLWLVKPNRVEAKLKFEIGIDSAEEETGRSRILDRMQWIAHEPDEEFSNEELELSRVYFRCFSEIYLRRGRLSNAMVLTLNGCWNNFWQGALILQAAALEAMLTFSRGPGLTKRLAISYACLTCSNINERNEAYKTFKELYSIRSDAMHGRIHNLKADRRLPTLSQFNDLVRSVWRAIICNSNACDVLDKSDSEREVFFQEVQNEFTPPTN